MDAPLERPPERVHMMLDPAAPWVEGPEGARETYFPEYPEESIEDWHRQRGLHGEATGEPGAPRQD